MNDWEKEFNEIFPKYSQFLGDARFINKLRNKVKSFIQAQLDKTIRAENKEWREGRRCEICGEAKPPNLTTMCDKCLENG